MGRRSSLEWYGKGESSYLLNLELPNETASGRRPGLLVYDYAKKSKFLFGGSYRRLDLFQLAKTRIQS